MKKDNRSEIEKRRFEEVINAFSDEEKEHALAILKEWKKNKDNN